VTLAPGIMCAYSTMLPKIVLYSLLAFTRFSAALRYDPSEVGYNLNENETAVDPLDYWGVWENHTHNPSPSNWRMPVYTMFLDRFVNGDPTNDNANGTQWEKDILSTQLRYGGDLAGLVDTLDYLQGMGVKVCPVRILCCCLFNVTTAERTVE